jgi:NAD/NADP transhydrogenase alpha subunit
VQAANETTMAWTFAVALSATLVVLTLVGVVGLWWAAFTADWRQASGA